MISDTFQQISIRFKHVRWQKEVIIIAVYARCSALERLELWDNLECIAENINNPWIVGGDQCDPRGDRKIRRPTSYN